MTLANSRSLGRTVQSVAVDWLQVYFEPSVVSSLKLMEFEVHQVFDCLV